MDKNAIRKILEAVSQNRLSIDDALDKLRSLPFEDIGFATIDHHRSLRCGFPEVIFCPGKTTEQITEIFTTLAKKNTNILATRANPQTYNAISKRFPAARYNPLAKTIVLNQNPSVEKEKSAGIVGVVCAGTSDLPVAEEARETLEIMNQKTQTIYDVGVAGLHRLLAHKDKLMQMNVIVVAAGMEGALPSVVAGLVSVPVIAVPTSVGYGASFNGLAALLGMLNSCAANVAVVNIDNGFSAGYIATLINNLASNPR